MLATPDFFEVVTPPDSKDLTVVASVKERLGITNADSDDKLLTLIHRCSSRIVNYTGREFGAQTIKATWRLETGWRRRIWGIAGLVVPVWPIKSVTSIVEDGTTLVAADWEADVRQGIIYRLDGSDARQSWGYGKIVVQYVGGYTLLPELPDEVEEVCLDLVKMAWLGADRDPALRAVEVAGQLREDFYVPALTDSSIPQQWRDVLNNYSRHGLA